MASLQSDRGGAAIRVIHVLRAPVGGLFRHVVDLTNGQIVRGHDVGLIVDSRQQNAHIEATLADLSGRLSLGLTRVTIDRNPGPNDVKALLHVARRVREGRPHILHGHGAKGGALARLTGFLPGLPPCARAYTPHGGSLNYRPGTSANALYMAIERSLRGRTDLLLLESGFIAMRYNQMVGSLPRLNRVIHNGVAPSEFEPIPLADDAADFVYVGELRQAKGIDTLLLALERIGAVSPPVRSLALVGSGPDHDLLRAQVKQLRLEHLVTFHAAMPVRSALRLGRIMVVPSRAESLPYVVLEAAAAGRPLVATNVGGIPEIFGPYRRSLIPCDSVTDLADAMQRAVSTPSDRLDADARALSHYVEGRFSLDVMIDSILAAYREALTPSPPPVLRTEQSMVLSS